MIVITTTTTTIIIIIIIIITTHSLTHSRSGVLTSIILDVSHLQ